MHARADMGSRKRAVMNLESRAISARVTKLLLFLVKHVINIFIMWEYWYVCRSAPLFCYPNQKTCHINCIMLCVL